DGNPVFPFDNAAVGCNALRANGPMGTQGQPFTATHPMNGGVRGYGAATVTGSNPAAIQVKKGFFHQAPHPTAVAVQQPTVIQLATTFGFQAPSRAAYLMLTPPNDGKLRKNAWSTQAGRVAANFTFCLGALMGPACPVLPQTVMTSMGATRNVTR